MKQGFTDAYVKNFGKLRKPLTFLINMLSDEIIIEGVKK